MFEIDDGKNKEREALFSQPARRIGESMDGTSVYQESDERSERIRKEAKEEVRKAMDYLKRLPEL